MKAKAISKKRPTKELDRASWPVWCKFKYKKRYHKCHFIRAKTHTFANMLTHIGSSVPITERVLMVSIVVGEWLISKSAHSPPRWVTYDIAPLRQRTRRDGVRPEVRRDGEALIAGQLPADAGVVVGQVDRTGKGGCCVVEDEHVISIDPVSAVTTTSEYHYV